MAEKLTNNVGLNNVVEKRMRVILEEGPKIPMDFEWVKPELPLYYDERKFQLGQRAFYNNVFSMMIAKLSGLVSLLSVRSILDIVMFTKQSGIPCLAYRRYAMTILHTLVWLEKDPIKSEEFVESLKIVRKKHCIAFRRGTEAGLHRPTQLDMSLAQFGFIGYIMVSSEKLGIQTTREEMEGLVHVWRVIGSMLGMKEEFNLCSGTAEEARALCQRILDEVFLPALTKKNEHFDSMGQVMLESLWTINFAIDSQAFITFTYQLASQSATNNNHSIVIDTSNMPFFSWYLFHMQCFVLKYLLRPTAWWSSFFRAMYNSLMRLSLFLLEKYPYFAIRRYGEKYAKIDIFRYRFDRTVN
ncbi:PREDICTED: uncharacterized protein LOC106741283 [Dinoponera quadriceps]|uniref:Uncharacterized protein LOC106741283 n=1 Tax=Dinoponera quadriceps TaxID=609295 RepID=A0A6P3WR54_DINQU|nr:PREDICTED: uncharacterized protein LOC106741283 [Dinoponera quadriceps]